MGSITGDTKSSVMLGQTWHSRFEVRQRHFAHKLFFLRVDLGELSQLSKNLRSFGYNRWSLFSVWDRDYLGPDSESAGSNDITEKLRTLLERKGFDRDFQRAVLITTPRVFGVVFNPVNFYLCYNREGELYALVGEVNNTFDESYAYVVAPSMAPKSSCPASAPAEDGCPWSASAMMAKAFFVSPFMDTRGSYHVSLSDDTRSFECSVSLRKSDASNQEGLSFVAGLEGRARPFTDKELIKALVRHPLTGWATLPLIYLHAVVLTWFHRVPLQDKPELSDRAMCRYARPRLLARWSDRLRRFVARRNRKGDVF